MWNKHYQCNPFSLGCQPASKEMASRDGFQARLDEMLHSRRVQLQRLNEESQLQASNRALLQERKAALKQIQQQILLLRRKLCQINVDIVSKEDGMQARIVRTDELAVEQRDIGKQVSILQNSQGNNECKLYQPERARILKFEAQMRNQVGQTLKETKALQDRAHELELLLKSLREDDEVATRRRQELADYREAVAAEVGRHSSVKCLLEKELQLAKQSLEEQKHRILLATRQEEEDIKSLQIDNELVERELLEILQPSGSRAP